MYGNYYKKNKRVINLNFIKLGLGIVFIFLIITFFIKRNLGEVIKGDYKVNSFTLEGANTKTFSDKIKVYLTEEDKIIEINIEEYVMGVLSGEMPLSFELEALKAQAVAARTYALGKTLNNCQKSNGADICDTVHCQVYKSKEQVLAGFAENKREEYYSKLTEAIEGTKGQVLSYDGQLVMNAQYFSTSWGMTEDSQSVFGKEIPYLKSVVSEGEEISNRYKSSISLTFDDFVNKINSKYSEAKLTTKSLKNQVEIVSRNNSGSVNEIKLGKLVISGKDFRGALGINSANFTLSFSNSNVKIECFGYGHGVGMSSGERGQWL